jgi:hypothetical protein
MSAHDDASFVKGLALAAARGAEYSSNAEDVTAFLVRYGTAAEIREQLNNVEQAREFFTKHVGERIAIVAGDGDTLDALNVVAARLQELYDRAEQYEWVMDLLGWRFDRQGQMMKYAEPGRRGPKTKLVSMSVEALFQRMVAEGWPESNTVEARAHIRQQLIDRGFAPDLLTDAIIENAIGNRVLNPDDVRHPKRKS